MALAHDLYLVEKLRQNAPASTVNAYLKQEMLLRDALEGFDLPDLLKQAAVLSPDPTMTSWMICKSKNYNSGTVDYPPLTCIAPAIAIYDQEAMESIADKNKHVTGEQATENNHEDFFNHHGIGITTVTRGVVAYASKKRFSVS